MILTPEMAEALDADAPRLYVRKTRGTFAVYEHERRMRRPSEVEKENSMRRQLDFNGWWELVR